MKKISVFLILLCLALPLSACGDGNTPPDYSGAGAGVVSATVIHESSALADAYATTVCVLGAEQGAEFLRKKDAKGVIITADHKFISVGLDFSYADMNGYNGFKSYTEIGGGVAYREVPQSAGVAYDLNESPDVFGIFTCMMKLKGGDYRAAADEIAAVLSGLDVKISTVNPQSPLYKFNHDKTDGKEYEIDRILYDMGVNSKALYADADAPRIYNPAVYPLVELWGVDANSLGEPIYTGNAPPLPTPEQWEAVRLNCNFDDITFAERDGKYYIKSENGASEGDFGAYAKGYAVDLARDILIAHGVEYGILDISGNVYLYNQKPDGNPWDVLVTHPEDPEGGSYFCVLSLDGSVSAVTSGTYERYYNLRKTDGVWAKVPKPMFGVNLTLPRVCHIIDGNIGMPINLAYDAETDEFYNI
jgi:thiamine biosynthesis lipoprotein ApbE